MKRYILILQVLIAITIEAKAQIPNNGFENWATVNGHDSLMGWYSGNITSSTDHYPLSVGQYSIKLTNNVPVTSRYSYGYSVTNSSSNGCLPSFPISGHPNQLRGYYKCFPLNNDTMQIAIILFNKGVGVAGGELTTTDTVSDWTSLNIPISSYTSADSATITIAAFYNDTTCGMPYGPLGNSILYVDNLSFDNLISSVSENVNSNSPLILYPNPASDKVFLTLDHLNNEDLTIYLYDIMGKLVKTEILRKNQHEININDLENGSYFVSVKSKDITFNQRLMIKK